MTKTERRINVLESALIELEKEYDKAFDELLCEDSAANQNKERNLFQRINQLKKELAELKADATITENEIDEMVTGVKEENQELTKAEEKLFDAIADVF